MTRNCLCSAFRGRAKPLIILERERQTEGQTDKGTDRDGERQRDLMSLFFIKNMTANVIIFYSSSEENMTKIKKLRTKLNC